MAADNKGTFKWNQHPLISTVLWVLGTDTGKIENTSTGNPSSTLKWKDQRVDTKSSLNEYINHVQPPVQPAAVAKVEEEEETQLRPGASYYRHEVERRVNDHPEDCEIGGPADYTPSPQWGFYIPITPPQSEMFSQAGRNSSMPVEQQS